MFFAAGCRYEQPFKQNLLPLVTLKLKPKKNKLNPVILMVSHGFLPFTSGPPTVFEAFKPRLWKVQEGEMLLEVREKWSRLKATAEVMFFFRFFLRFFFFFWTEVGCLFFLFFPFWFCFFSWCFVKQTQHVWPFLRALADVFPGLANLSP